jgi:hypothetical protein
MTHPNLLSHVLGGLRAIEEGVKYAKKDGLESMLQLLEQHGVNVWDDLTVSEGDIKEAGM